MTKLPPPYASAEEAIGALEIALLDLKQLLRAKPGLADIPIGMIDMMRREMESEDPDRHTAIRLANMLHDVREVDRVRAMCHIANVGYDKDHKHAISLIMQLRQDLPLEAIRCFLMLDYVDVRNVYNLLDQVRDVNEQFRIYYQLYPHEDDRGKQDVLTQMRNLADRTHDELLPHVTWSMVYERSGESSDLEKVLACFDHDGDVVRVFMTHVRIFRASGLYKDWVTMINFIDRHHTELRNSTMFNQAVEVTCKHFASLRHKAEHSYQVWLWLGKVVNHYKDPLSLIKYYRIMVGLGNTRAKPNYEQDRLTTARKHLLEIEDPKDPKYLVKAQLQFIRLLADLGKPFEARNIAKRMSSDYLLEMCQAYCEVVRARQVEGERQIERDKGMT